MLNDIILLLQAVDGQTCYPTCVKGGDVCMRYTYFKRDGDQTMDKYVNFCGKGVQGRKRRRTRMNSKAKPTEAVGCI